MDETKKLVAAALTEAFYAGQEPRQAFLGKDRRSRTVLASESREMRSPTITPAEVFAVYRQFIEMLNRM